MATLTVIRPGLQTTIQDLGRWGYQSAGVPVAGPMDVYSHRLANRIVGNGDEAAALEVTLLGPELISSGDITCAVCGAEFELFVDDAAARGGQPLRLSRGSRLRFGPRGAGARATLAVGGGLDVPAVLGSRSTSVVAGIGPFGGRPLRAGDVLSVATSVAARASAPGHPLRLPRGGARVRAIPGPHDGRFAPATVEQFFASQFLVLPQSNRMGYRLEGPALPASGQAAMLSEATPIGSVQVPPSGQPILLMADRQTIGGYPRIATVITADLPLAGQLAPGDWIRFARCSRSEAVSALRSCERRLGGGAS